MKFITLGILIGFCISFSKGLNERFGCTFFDVKEQIHLHSHEQMVFSREHIGKCAHSLMKEASQWFSGSFELMFPNAVWLPEENAFLTVVRVVINQTKSFLYAALFNEQWEQILEERKVGKIMLPCALPIKVTNYLRMHSGPEDPRLFRASNGDWMCIFNMLDPDGRRKMFLFNFETTEFHRLFLQEYSKRGLIPMMEKNWTPLVVEGAKDLHFVYNFKNSQVIKFKGSQCSLVNGDFDPVPGIIKGGSPFYRFQQSDYYFCFSFTHYLYDQLRHNCVVYRPMITIVKAKPLDSGSQIEFSYVYNSEPLDFDGELFGLPQGQVADFCGNGRIAIAVSMARMDYSKDESILTVNVNDNKPLLLRISGLDKFISAVIDAYEKGTLKFSIACAELLVKDYFDAKKRKRL